MIIKNKLEKNLTAHFDRNDFPKIELLNTESVKIPAAYDGADDGHYLTALFNYWISLGRTSILSVRTVKTTAEDVDRIFLNVCSARLNMRLERFNFMKQPTPHNKMLNDHEQVYFNALMSIILKEEGMTEVYSYMENLEAYRQKKTENLTVEEIRAFAQLKHIENALWKTPYFDTNETILTYKYDLINKWGAQKVTKIIQMTNKLKKRPSGTLIHTLTSMTAEEAETMLLETPEEWLNRM